MYPWCTPDIYQIRETVYLYSAVREGGRSIKGTGSTRSRRQNSRGKVILKGLYTK